MKALLVEDDALVADVVSTALGAEGLQVDHVSNGRDGMLRSIEHGYDVILLDVGLPDVDGFQVCAAIRRRDRITPVLMLTGRDGIGDLVHGLDVGADDYLSKPFSTQELTARLRALLRRSMRDQPATHLVVGDIDVDPAARTVHRGGQPVELVGREYALVQLLAIRAGQVVGRDEIIAELWDFAADVHSNTLDVLVSSVRQKLDRPFGTSDLRTIRGSGYALGTSQ